MLSACEAFRVGGIARAITPHLLEPRIKPGVLAVLPLKGGGVER